MSCRALASASKRSQARRAFVSLASPPAKSTRDDEECPKKVGPEADNRWDKIAKEVGTRSKDQCKKRQKQINSPAK